MLSTRTDEMADRTKPRCTDRRSQPALFIYTLRSQLDAGTKQASYWMGIRFPASLWTFGQLPSNQPTLISEAIRRGDRLQSARRRRVCKSWVSTGKDICSA